MKKNSKQTIIPLFQVEYVVNEEEKTYNVGARYSSLLEELLKKDTNAYNAVLKVIQKTFLKLEEKVKEENNAGK